MVTRAGSDVAGNVSVDPNCSNPVAPAFNGFISAMLYAISIVSPAKKRRTVVLSAIPTFC